MLYATFQSSTCNEKARYRRYSRGEFAKLPPYHVFCDGNFVVNLAIVYLKTKSDKVGKNGRGACLRLDWLRALPRLRTHDRKPLAIGQSLLEHESRGGREKYGTMCGPEIELPVSESERVWLHGMHTFPDRSSQERSRWKHC